MTQIVSPHAPSTTHARTSAIIDARPTLPRSSRSVWERTEQLRRELAVAVEAECARTGIEALVLQSDPYVHPAWVKFECWMPRGDEGLTARAAMTVTITAVPCHHFETVYKVEWERHGRTHTIDHLYRFGEAEIAAMIPHLCGDPERLMSGFLPDGALRLLRQGQLRQASWQLWKPRNKIATVRRDPLLWLGLAALTVGGLLWINGVRPVPSVMERAQNRELLGPSISTGESTDAVVRTRQQSDTTNTAGASTLEKDLPASGSLDERDPSRAGGMFYDTWIYRATAGESFSVSMESSDFDSFLLVGVMQDSEFTTVVENDDHGGQPHARVEVTATEPREYVILASSYAAGVTGGYTLQVHAPTLAEVPLTELPSGTEQTLYDSDPATEYGVLSYLGMLLMMGGVAGLVVSARAPRLVRSAGKPMGEPRILYSLDSWQTVVFGAGEDAHVVRDRLIELFNAPGQNRFACGTERVWYWGLDGKSEREQLVLRFGRALVFCQIQQYGADLYVGWNAQMNLGTWREKKLTSGVDVETGARVRVMTVEHAIQPTNDYDLTDLNSLAEWTHAQVTTVLKLYLKEKAIDQEIDFAIIRGQREGLQRPEEKDTQRRRFQRKA